MAEWRLSPVAHRVSVVQQLRLSLLVAHELLLSI